MESKKSMLAGSLIASAILGLSNLGNASTLTAYTALGSGAEVRSELLNTPSAINGIELTCGADSTKHHAKGKDGKCGEGKCGDHKKDAKAGDHKAGDHKAGEHKKEVKDAKPAAEPKKDEKNPK